MAVAGNAGIVQVDTERLDGNSDALLHFYELRRKICPLFIPLRRNPDSDVEKLLFKDDVLCDDVSEATIVECDKLYEEMQAKLLEKRNANIFRLQIFKAKLDELIANENVDLEYTVGDEDYAEKLQGLEAQLDTMTTRKASAAARSIAQIRTELQEIWRRSMVTETEGVFPEFAITELNENVYRVHLQHLQKWRDYYDRNQALFNEVKERTRILKRLEEIKKENEDKDRFKNRGGKLLKLQSEETRLKASLPKCEAKLLQLATEFEKENKKKVIVDDQELIPTLIAQKKHLPKLYRSSLRPSMRNFTTPPPLRVRAGQSTFNLSTKRKSTSNPDLGSKRNRLESKAKDH